MSATLTANPRITAEEFDGETVLIDVEKGVYYSLRGAACDLWRAFGEPNAPDAVVQAFATRFPEADAAGLQATIAQFHDNGLLAPSAQPAAPTVPALPSAYTAPGFDAFTDLAELIAIDPVHEVDAAAGWPVRPANFPDVR